MSSTNDNLPPYQEKAFAQETTSSVAYPSRLAGTIQTCSIKDGQVDYFSLIRVSDSTYHLSLTIDPTPLYRIELCLGSSKVGNIQIFSASDSTLLAAARTSGDQKSKTLPIGMVCTSSPAEPNASWRPVAWGKSWLPLWIDTHIPVVTIPGRPAKPQHFEWRVEEGKGADLKWEGKLPTNFINPAPIEYNFARVIIEPDGGETLVEIRRGAGIDFELSVILEAFLLIDLTAKAKSA
ncbi:unnamed protein product [Clonostachys byssicola]|uniref:Uncharacterized protein n=1 Tax=Clonostachys byssicola TaxID=160290 RepID=A0A9N9Y2E1_9HYPO|nr:unnamed protein product [Clonostachys byssicola]